MMNATNPYNTADLLKYLSLERNGIPGGFNPQSQPAAPNVADEEFWASLGQQLSSTTYPQTSHNMFGFDRSLQEIQNFDMIGVSVMDNTGSIIPSTQNPSNSELPTGTRDAWLAFMEDSGLTQFGVL